MSLASQTYRNKTNGVNCVTLLVNQVELGIRNRLAESERSNGLIREIRVSLRASKMQDLISM